MQESARTHYEILDVRRDAKITDINRAYQRLRREMQRETSVPDPRRALLVERAYEVLSDESRRAAYDEELRRPHAVLERTRASRARMIAIAVASVALLGAVGWWQFGGGKSAPKVASRQEILEAVGSAVGRVQAVDMDGTARTIGLAFALREGVLASTCRDLAPTSQLVVAFGPRKVPARVADTTEHPAICRLAAEGLGSWPLTLAMRDPPNGSTLYVPAVRANGEIALLSGQLKRIVPEADGPVMETTLPLENEAAGAPVLDPQGKVVGIAGGDGRARPIPSAWIAEARGPLPEVERPVAKAAREPKAVGPDAQPGRKIQVPGDL